MRDVIRGVQKEELAILHTLARLYLSGAVIPTLSNFTEYLNYLINTRFQGLRLKFSLYNTEQALGENQRKITSLSV